jgi:hypothetical protein
MKCGECNYKEIIAGTGMQKCKLTEETRLPLDACNCEDRRALRDREAEISYNKEFILNSIDALKERIVEDTTTIIDPQHIINILTDASKDSGMKIAEAIEYLEDFV